MANLRFVFLLPVVLWMTVAARRAIAEVPQPAPGRVTPELRQRAVQILRFDMARARFPVNVHAAETLLSLDYPQGVGEVFRRELLHSAVHTFPWIGACRVLAQAGNRQEYIDKLRDAFLDPNVPNRRGLAESLAKLGYAPAASDRPAFESAAQSTDEDLGAFARWVLSNSDPSWLSSVAQLLRSRDGLARENSAYALRYQKTVPPDIKRLVIEAARQEPRASHARVYMVSAAYVHAGDDSTANEFGAELLNDAVNGDPEQKFEAAQALAIRGSPAQLPVLTRMLLDADPDVNVGACRAILRIERRTSRSLSPIDWAVIGAYVMGMLAIGFYYSRRPQTSEEYLLGSRRMKSWVVGLSLFATLFSVVSYLAVPGEMIRYGPMILAGYASLPLIFYVVGWMLIPYIMKLRVTSAYELLELRFGLSARMTGSLFFLSMRLLWMAAITYTISQAVLIPLTGLDPRFAPLAAAAVGVITLIYTSMGGFRAVVITDVVQAFILFGSAILGLVLITHNLGGISHWFPRSWDPGWTPARIRLDPNMRFTVANAMILTFLWWVCTCGSDQIAIQRYLSTRDARAARRSLLVSLASDCAATSFLALLGFALLAYFRANPQLLADNQTIGSSADKLFPRFIAIGLPVGISGLAIAGLLAAAMSALASGLNSTSTVIAVDLIARFRHRVIDPASNARSARLISICVGVAVVLLSVTFDHVAGNLLEVVSKVVGVFVAPLFVLFFMAMFVPWATSLGTIAGAISGLAIGAAIAFHQLFGISFTWIMPCALAVGIPIAAIVSLVPISAPTRKLPSAAAVGPAVRHEQEIAR